MGDFAGVAEGDLTGGEPGVFGFVADEGYGRVGFVEVVLWKLKRKGKKC